MEIPNVLVVCGRNKRRSKTAEAIFRDSTDFQIQSAGLSPKSASKVTAAKVLWADAILVMEDRQKTRIIERFRNLDLPPIFVLHIDDIYEYMDAELVEMLEEMIPDVLQRALG